MIAHAPERCGVNSPWSHCRWPHPTVSLRPRAPAPLDDQGEQRLTRGITLGIRDASRHPVSPLSAVLLPVPIAAVRLDPKAAHR
ncbi:hypothetical protein QF035_001618 [Streptomyces umbrinus]|uniref:Uncharacterized protein n=1 Tax=Streptomyces umbrinus TaxID=67370 RepID=A0ABU0SKE0_9ACTN|nr:hypothetical protein [Streptomyces umbrinus]MDQ1024036.1 hypothetical protein [Streptomyces umbrinus]